MLKNFIDLLGVSAATKNALSPSTVVNSSSNWGVGRLTDFSGPYSKPFALAPLLVTHDGNTAEVFNASRDLASSNDQGFAGIANKFGRLTKVDHSGKLYAMNSLVNKNLYNIKPKFTLLKTNELANICNRATGLDYQAQHGVNPFRSKYSWEFFKSVCLTMHADSDTLAKLIGGEFFNRGKEIGLGVLLLTCDELKSRVYEYCKNILEQADVNAMAIVADLSIVVEDVANWLSVEMYRQLKKGGWVAPDIMVYEINQPVESESLFLTVGDILTISKIVQFEELLGKHQILIPDSAKRLNYRLLSDTIYQIGRFYMERNFESFKLDEMVTDILPRLTMYYYSRAFIDYSPKYSQEALFSDEHVEKIIKSTNFFLGANCDDDVSELEQLTDHQMMQIMKVCRLVIRSRFVRTMSEAEYLSLFYCSTIRDVTDDSTVAAHILTLPIERKINTNVYRKTAFRIGSRTAHVMEIAEREDNLVRDTLNNLNKPYFTSQWYDGFANDMYWLSPAGYHLFIRFPNDPEILKAFLLLGSDYIYLFHSGDHEAHHESKTKEELKEEKEKFEQEISDQVDDYIDQAKNSMKSEEKDKSKGDKNNSKAGRPTETEDDKSLASVTEKAEDSLKSVEKEDRTKTIEAIKAAIDRVSKELSKAGSDSEIAKLSAMKSQLQSKFSGLDVEAVLGDNGRDEKDNIAQNEKVKVIYGVAHSWFKLTGEKKIVEPNTHYTDSVGTAVLLILNSPLKMKYLSGKPLSEYVGNFSTKLVKGHTPFYLPANYFSSKLNKDLVVKVTTALSSQVKPNEFKFAYNLMQLTSFGQKYPRYFREDETVKYHWLEWVQALKEYEDHIEQIGKGVYDSKDDRFMKLSEGHFQLKLGLNEYVAKLIYSFYRGGKLAIAISDRVESSIKLQLLAQTNHSVETAMFNHKPTFSLLIALVSLVSQLIMVNIIEDNEADITAVFEELQKDTSFMASWMALGGNFGTAENAY